ncbi:MAG: TIGR03663 family protein [Spirochaetia bacterium]|nr:TIGR03663 family protein [Spirochaetia bacterium]
MAETLKCPKCGEENPKTNRFCDSCGTKLAAVAAQAPAAREEAAKPEKIKKTRAVAKAVYAPEEEGADTDIRSEVGGLVINWEMLAWAGIIITAILLRFIALGEKPLHHDESMHAFYSWKLFKGEGYTYNPMMHGPVHYHANALIYFLFGASDYTSRVAPAIFGIAGILFIWFLRPYLGPLGTVLTAFIMAISPTFTYQARFIREDIFMAVETLMIFIGLLRYFDSKKLSWLIFAAVGLALAWATKEANYITLFIFGTFLIFRWLWEYSLRGVADKFDRENKVYGTVNYWLGSGKKDFLWALGAFALVFCFLYYGKQGGIGNIWANLKYIWDGLVGGLLYWLGQHGVQRGSQPAYFYILMLPFYEMLAVAFMLVASVYYLVKAEKRTFFNVFCIYWWIMSMIVYSWAGEKMPWLAIHPLLPMVLLAGSFASDVFKMGGWKQAFGVASFAILAMASLHGTTYVCFNGEGADPKESLVYVQTSTDVTRVANKIKQFAREMKGEKWASQEFREYDIYNLDIVCEDYCTWPFAWYLRDFKKIAYEPKNIPESRIGSPIILSGIEEANAGHDLRVKEMLDKDYVATRYKLREWWAPDEKKWWEQMKFGEKMDWLWKRFMYRDVWNELGSYDMIVYVRRDLEKYWRSWEGK